MKIVLFCFLVPGNHNEILEEYTRQGFRVIALAHRLVEIRSLHKVQKVQREDIENELTFLGIIVNPHLNKNRHNSSIMLII